MNYNYNIKSMKTNNKTESKIIKLINKPYRSINCRLINKIPTKNNKNWFNKFKI